MKSTICESNQLANHGGAGCSSCYDGGSGFDAGCKDIRSIVRGLAQLINFF